MGEIKLGRLNEEGSQAFKRRAHRLDVARSALGNAIVFCKSLKDPDYAHDAEALEKMARLWDQVLSDEHIRTAYSRVPDSYDSDHWLQQQTLDRLASTASQAPHVLLGNGNRGGISQLAQDLIQEFNFTMRRAEVFNLQGDRGIDEALQMLAPYREQFVEIESLVENHQRKRARDAVDRLEAKEREGSQALKALKRASGSYGDEVMSSFYAEMSDDETRSANKFRTWTVRFTLVGGVVALAFLFLPPDLIYPVASDVDRLIRLVQKAIFVAGVFGIAAYMSRQAHQHRALANWAKSLAVQLQTFDAYVAAVDSQDARDDLRKSFATRAFGEHPALKGEQPGAQTTTVDDALDLMTKISKLMPGAKPGS